MFAYSLFHGRTEMSLNKRGFLGSEALRDGLADRGHPWIRGTGQEAFPGLGVHPWLYVSAQLQVSFVEARPGQEHKKVPLVEVDHGVVHRILDAVVERLELGDDVADS